ncbi:MAG: hypothetical protein ACHQT8_02255 [Chlamydiales bacterium]
MKRLLALFLLLPILARGEEYPAPTTANEVEEFWSTGTLLSPFAYVTPKGYIDVEPMLFVTRTNGRYDRNWRAQDAPKAVNVNALLVVQIGITDRIDFQIIPDAFYNHIQGTSSTNFGDLPLGFDFQLLSEKKGEWWPAIKFSIIEIFPTGKYQRLDPKKNGTDVTGLGAYATVPFLVFSKRVNLPKPYSLNTYFTLEYLFAPPVHVRGYNTYGGGFGTRGTVRPGNIFTAILSGELNLTKNWVLVLDIQNIYGNKSSFSGKHGKNADGTRASVGAPSFNELTLAPAIEYNFSAKWGVIAGAWFAIAGRNTERFAGGTIAINWYLNIKQN